MNKESTLIILVSATIAAILAFTAFIFFYDTDSPTTTSEATSSEVVVTPTFVEREIGTYSTESVSEHSVATDCWTIIGTDVYDITEYVPKHPGGDEVLRACGTDGTTLFNERRTTGGEVIGNGAAHSRTATSLLQSFKIGTLESN